MIAIAGGEDVARPAGRAVAHGRVGGARGSRAGRRARDAVRLRRGAIGRGGRGVRGRGSRRSAPSASSPSTPPPTSRARARGWSTASSCSGTSSTRTGSPRHRPGTATWSSPAVRAEGLEPPQAKAHQLLRLARLPIPPRPRAAARPPMRVALNAQKDSRLRGRHGQQRAKVTAPEPGQAGVQADEGDRRLPAAASRRPWSRSSRSAAGTSSRAPSR